MQSEPIPPLPVESTQATFVDTFEGVKEMLEELKQQTEIAVDLEHHDAHSFIGLVSLMQISTRKKDWIIDTLKPWREDLQILNEVFADPKIVKVSKCAFKSRNQGVNTGLGFSWGFHGYNLATKRPGTIRGRLIRHLPCFRVFEIRRKEPGSAVAALCRFRRR